MKTIYLGNLPPATSEATLSGLFEKFGPLMSCSFIRPRDPRILGCFAFVELEDDKKALQAIQELHCRKMEGSEIEVNEARALRDHTVRGPRDDNSSEYSGDR